MSFDARVLNVLIASPGDTKILRDEVERCLMSWNRDRSTNSSVVALPRRWEFDSIPSFGADAQSVINEQLVSSADILIGIFHSRLGQVTARSASGTAEEIEGVRRAGKPVHVYFAEMPHPANVDTLQLNALSDFKHDMIRQGLMGSFASADDLVNQVRSAIEFDVAGLGLITPRPALVKPLAILRARYGVLPPRRVLVVQNDGDDTARQVSLTLAADTQVVPRIQDDLHPSIPPHGEFAFTLDIRGDVPAVEVNMRWIDRDGDAHEFAHSVSLY